MIAFVAFLVMSFAYDAILLYIFGFLLGYGLLSAGPVALELAVDVTHPVPEASSNGMLMMIGQVGGIVFILAFEDFTIGGDYFPALIFLTVLIFVLLILAIFLKDVKRE